MADDGGVTGGEAVELDNLIISLIGDPSGYLDSLKEVIAQTNEAAQKIVAGGSRLVAAFEEQIATFGMTTREVALYRAEVEGAGTAEIETARRLHAQLTQMEEERSATQAAQREQRLAAAAAEQATLKTAALAEQELQAVLAQGAAVTRSLETAEERRARQQADLNHLLQQGAISQETYTRAMTRTAEVSRNLLTSMQAMSQSLLSLGSGFGMASGFEGLLGQFGRSESLMLSLNAAVENSGTNVKETVARYKEFAKEMFDVGAIAKETTLSILAQSAQVGIVGEQAERVARNAAAISKLLGTNDPESGARAAIQLEQGRVPFQLGRMFGVNTKHAEGDEETSKQEKVLEIQQALAKNFSLVEAGAQTTQARIDRLRVSLIGMGIEVGGMLAEAVRPLVVQLQQLVNWFNSLEQSTRSGIATTLAATAALAAMARVVPLITGALALNPLTAALTVLAAVAVTIASIGSRSTETTDKLAAMNRELEKAAAERAGDSEDSRQETKRTINRANAVDDPNERLKALEAAHEKAKDLADFARDQLEEVKKEQAELNNQVGWKRPTADQKSDLEAAARNVEEYSGRLKDAKERVSALDAAVRGLADNVGFEKLIGDAEKYAKSLEEARDTVGMTADEKKLREFARRGASTPGADLNLDELARLQAEKAAAEEQDKLTESVHASVNKMREQANTFGMTAREAEAYRLSLQNTTRAQQDMYREMDETLTRLERQKKLMEQGAEVTKSVASPQEKFDAKLGELNELVNKGAISFDTYGKAVEQARQSLLGAKEAMSGIQQAGAGSADAISRLEAFRDKMNDLSGSKGREQAVARDAERAHAEGRELPYPGALPRGKTDPFGARPDREASTAKAGHELDEVAQAVEAAAQDRMEHEVLDIVADWEQWAREVEEKTAAVPPPEPTAEDRIKANPEGTPVPEIDTGKAKNDPNLARSQTDLMTKMLAALNKLVDKPVAEFEGTELA